jgi:hypothetical protein
MAQVEEQWEALSSNSNTAKKRKKKTKKYEKSSPRTRETSRRVKDRDIVLD